MFVPHGYRLLKFDEKKMYLCQSVNARGRQDLEEVHRVQGSILFLIVS